MDTLAVFNEEDEVVQLSENNIAFIVDEATFGKGTLYVAESKLYWKNDTNNQVFSVDYKSMCVFGTCNHPTVHEKPCMQIIVDFTFKPPDGMISENGHTQNGDVHENQDEEENDSDDNDDDDEEEEMKSKIKLVPDNPECLTEMYAAFTRVQPLHNNTNDLDSDEEENGEFENDDFEYNENDEFEDYDEDNCEPILRN